MWSDTRMNGSYESDIFLMNQKHTVQPVWSNSWTNDYYEWIGLSKSKLYCENNVVWFLNKLLLWTVLFTESESYSKTRGRPIIGADIKHFTDYRYRPF